MTTSIGIAFTRGELSGPELLKRADTALYEAKRRGRDRYQIDQTEQPAPELRDAPVRARL